jgi:hypothetical protein
MQQEVEMMDDQQAKEIQSYTRIFFLQELLWQLHCHMFEHFQ